MQRPVPRLSLNCLRVFEAAARFRSLKVAAAELGVTPSAVSHQVRQLETDLGVRLFLRASNGMELTDEGRRLFEGIEAAITTISRAQETIRRDAGHVTLRVSASLACRWLIPHLNTFRCEHPKITVRIEISRPPHVLDPGVDIGIRYSRSGAPDGTAKHLIADQARPVVSPVFAAASRRLPHTLCIETTPLLSATADDWDWRQWAAMQGISFAKLRIADRFDVDHAALEACQAGMGVFLATESLITRELQSGWLVPLSGYETVHLGDYWMQTARPSRGAVQKLAAWIAKTASGAGRK